jgi:hypothetical protein
MDQAKLRLSIAAKKFFIIEHDSTKTKAEIVSNRLPTKRVLYGSFPLIFFFPIKLFWGTVSTS